MTNLESDMTFPTYGGEVKPATGATLFALGSWLRRGKASADARQLFLEGGRDGDSFYRDRWSYDKIVRSTHGVNCTGSCSWKIFVKDGVITWETQQTDYPTTGADMPEYEPRGCPRGAAFSWYEYSPTRIKYPYVRGVLLDMFREAKKRLGDPVDAWAAVVEDPEKARAYKSQRGRGGMVRVSWEEAMEIVAAAYVHTIKQYGPDRIAGFSVIPAMSMISYGAGARFHELIGATMLSFYDWYADLPPASPQVFGDQTDVPEAGDWFNSQYLIMWGTNLPLTRTPDAHFMAEARYHGQKVIVVSPDFADNTKFADDWLRVQPGTDGALAQAMGHVILKEFHVGKREPMFLDYMKRYTDSPFLVEINEVGEGAHEGIAPTTLVPGKFLTAAKMPAGTTERTENNQFRPLVIEADGTVKDPGGTLADRFGEEGAGHWNLNLDGVEPVMSIMDTDEWEAALIALPRFDLPAAPGQASVGGGYVKRGVPARRVNGRLVTTVFDILLAQYAVEREGLPGQWPTDYMDASTPGTPAWQEEFTSVPAAAAIKIGREFAQNAVETQGRSMILMGAGTNHYYHSDEMYRTFLALTEMCGTQGRNGGGWAHYVGQEKVRPIMGWGSFTFALDWARPPRQMISTGWYYMTTDQWRYDGPRPRPWRTRSSPRTWTANSWSTPSSSRFSAAGCPATRRSPRARPSWVARPPRPAWPPRNTCPRSCARAVSSSRSRTRTPTTTSRRSSRTGVRTCSARPRRAPSSSCATCWAPATRLTPRSWKRATAPRPSTGVRLTPASSTSCGLRTSVTPRRRCTPTSCCPPPRGTRSTTCPPRTCTPSCTASTRP